MSRLFGFIAVEPLNLSCNLIKNSELVETVSSEKLNGDGWGIGFFRNNSSFIFKKAAKSSGLRDITSISEVVSSNIFLSQFRLATVGEKKEANTQPYRWGNWIFSHSGTINHFRKIRNRISRKLPTAYKRQIQGNTDSEYCFYYYLTFLRGEGGIKKGECSLESAIQGLKDFGKAMMEICEEVEAVKLPEMNFMVSNGKYLIATSYGLPLYYKTYSDKEKFEAVFYSPKTDIQVNLANLTNSNKYMVISTEKLTNSSDWNELENSQILSASPSLDIQIDKWI